MFPTSLGGWRDPSKVLRVWRQVCYELAMTGLVSHTLKTVAIVLDDAKRVTAVSRRGRGTQ